MMMSIVEVPISPHHQQQPHRLWTIIFEPSSSTQVSQNRSDVVRLGRSNVALAAIVHQCKSRMMQVTRTTMKHALRVVFEERVVVFSLHFISCLCDRHDPIVTIRSSSSSSVTVAVCRHHHNQLASNEEAAAQWRTRLEAYAEMTTVNKGDGEGLDEGDGNGLDVR
jgi:hypothetical protein